LLLVEDDASIRRFVSLALEEHALELVEAADLQSAIQALRSGPFDLVLCDLMLPDGNGIDLLQALSGPDSPSPGARRVAFSAGVSSDTREQLRAVGVHAVLAKPASLAALLACVQEALAAAPGQPPSAQAQAASADDSQPHVEEAVARYFGGHHGLYNSYAATCRQQFARDAAQGDAAAGAQDLAALRRLAHSLKSVLLTLGLGRDSALALAIDHAAAAGQAGDAWRLWPQLRARLCALSAAPPPSPDA
jgi:CheY-like chemotaxis protein